MPDLLDNVLSELPGLRERLQPLREMLLANAVMFAEIPGPTFEESRRVRFMLDRLTEAGCLNVSTDEVGNAVGIHPGVPGSERYILVSAHLDTPFEASLDHTAKVSTDSIEGPGILDNSMGLSAIATLPSILDKLGIKLQSNLILAGTSRSMGRGDIEGMRFFLEGNPLPIEAGVIVEGGTLGRLSFTALGMLRGVITVTLPKDYDFSVFAAGGAIAVLNRIITRILGIPIPREPATSIILGAMDGGTTYNTIAKRAVLRFEIRSEQQGMVGDICDQIENICEEIAATARVEVSFEKVARRHNGGLDYQHPLVRGTRKIFETMEVEPRPAASTGELAALMEKGIPGVTIGLTKGEFRHQPNERVEIEPVFTGLAQLIGLLLAIDGGLCDAVS